MGGYVALAFAEKYERMLNGLGLFQSTAYADTDEKKATRKKSIAFMKEHGALEFLKTALPGTYSPATKEANIALIDQQLQAASGFTTDTLIAYYEAMLQRPDRTGWLRHTALPVLFVMSTQDSAIPYQDCLAQCHLPQLAYIHLLEHSGHMGMVEEPEIANAILKKYLSETVGLL
jgi:pimeloyl-ACP methyl ester carboxylesterase